MIGRWKKQIRGILRDKFSGKKQLILREFRRKIRDKFCRTTIVKKATISRQFFFFGGGGKERWALALCNNNNNRDIDYL